MVHLDTKWWLDNPRRPPSSTCLTVIELPACFLMKPGKLFNDCGSYMLPFLIAAVCADFFSATCTPFRGQTAGEF